MSQFSQQLLVFLTLALVPVAASLAQPPTGLTPRELFYAKPATTQAPQKSTQAKQATPAKDPTAQQPKSAAAKPVDKPPEKPVEKPSAKRTESLASKPLGLRYSIIKYAADGSSGEVDSDSVFHTGDLIRLRVRVNEPGYLYVAHRGSSGNWQIMYPSKDRDGGNNEVLPGREYDVPGSTRLIFDETPGEERLFVIVSRQPESQLDRMIYDLDRAQQLQEGKKGETLIAQAQIPDSTVGSIRMAARDLVFEKVDSSKPAPPQAGGRPETAVYVVNASGSKDARLVADITLKHR